MKTSTVLTTALLLLFAINLLAGVPEKVNRMIRKGKFEKAENLIMKKEVELNMKDGRGIYPLEETIKTIFFFRSDRTIRNKGVEFVRFLLDNGAEFYKSNRKPCEENAFAHSLRYGLSDVADLMLDNGLIPTECNLNMNYAAMYNDTAIVGRLLRMGVSPNGSYEAKKTPLHISLYGNRPTDVAEQLILNGADLNRTDLNGFSAIHLALWNEKRDMTELLVELGADLNSVDDFGMAPLHVVIEQKDHVFEELLLSNGADADIKGKDGHTALHLAAKNLDADAISILLRYGASPNIFSSDSLLPLHLACTYENNSMDCYRILMEGGSKLSMNTRNPMFAEASGTMYRLAAEDSSNTDYQRISLWGFTVAKTEYLKELRTAKKELAKRRAKVAAVIILGAVQAGLGAVSYGMTPYYNYTPHYYYSNEWTDLLTDNKKLDNENLKQKIGKLEKRYDTCNYEVVNLKNALGIELEGKHEKRMGKRIARN